ncbi:MAG: RNA-binding S4 domain-containing protein [Lachnospiraceae bacterium]|nr:RNA-binding S4 domain-containing protein [Lachnospiraceae bacterium]
MEIFTLRDEHIRLGQLLKAVGFVESGVDAKDVILQGMVQVNGETVYQRGKKCYDGDIIDLDGQQVTVRSKMNGQEEHGKS